ncbi:MAG: hypothetical protein ACFFC7_11175 [Candidatus Hermodarchaeota archaeon]
MIQLTVKGQNIYSIIDGVKHQRNAKYLQTWKVQGNIDQVSILILESYSFRISSDLTITIIFEFKKPSLEEEVFVTILASGGKAGLLQLDWGAQSSRERGVLKRIEELARTREWSIIHEGRK